MARKSAIQKIEHHEKICRLMQRQTFDRIDRMEARIARLEKWIINITTDFQTRMGVNT